MLLMQHPAPPALAPDSDESFAIRTRGLDFVIDECSGCVSDSKARAPDSLRHLGLFLMPARAGTKALVERSHLPERVRPKSHVRAEHSTHLDHIFAMVGDRQVQVNGHRSDDFFGIFGRQDSPLHRSELAMDVKELLDRLEIARRNDQIVVEKDQYFTSRLRDCAILNAAFSGARFVQML